MLKLVLLSGVALASSNLSFVSPVNSTMPEDAVRLVVGGSLLSNSPILDYYQGFPSGSVHYITAAGSNPVGDATSIGNWFRQAGIEATWIPIYGSNCAQRAFDPEYVAMVDVASAIYMSGGQSGNVQSCLFGGQTTHQQTPLLTAMQAKGIIGGSSAGAMNQPRKEILITGSSVESYSAVRAGSVFYRDNGNGFLLSDELVDVHFAERGRQGRLVVFAAAVQAKWAFGVDENTAYVWTPAGEYEVVGENGVAIYEDSEGDAASQSATMHFLTPGDKIDIQTGVIAFAEWKSPCDSGSAPSSSNSLFSSDNYRVISIQAAQYSVPGSFENLHGSPAVSVTFSNQQAQAYCGSMEGVDYVSFRDLAVKQTGSTDLVNTEQPDLPLDFIWPFDA